MHVQDEISESNLHIQFIKGLYGKERNFDAFFHYALGFGKPGRDIAVRMRMADYPPVIHGRNRCLGQ
ncbi:hypothetical protein [Proteiniphilum sp.]|uniref:hypothetical protein n=1 Tax=Proteiniphilum sp. TaxID=1926877 RepID=UPI00331FCE91